MRTPTVRDSGYRRRTQSQVMTQADYSSADQCRAGPEPDRGTHLQQTPDPPDLGHTLLDIDISDGRALDQSLSVRS